MTIKKAKIRSKEIAQELMDEFIEPRYQIVRERLLSEPGYTNPSNTSIQQGLADFWDEHMNWVAHQKRRPNIPQPVFDAAQVLFDAAHEAAGKSFSDQQHLLNQEKEEWLSKIEAAKLAVQQSQKQVEELVEKTNRLERERENDKINYAREIKELTESRDELNTNCQVLEEALQNSRNSIESYKSQLQEESKRFERRFAEEMERNQAEETRLLKLIDQARTDLKEKEGLFRERENIWDKQQDTMALKIEHLTIEVTKTQSALSHYQQQEEIYKRDVSRSENSVMKLQKANAALEDKYAKVVGELSQMQYELGSAKREVELLKQQIDMHQED